MGSAQRVQLYNVNLPIHGFCVQMLTSSFFGTSVPEAKFMLLVF